MTFFCQIYKTNTPDTIKTIEIFKHKLTQKNLVFTPKDTFEDKSKMADKTPR